MLNKLALKLGVHDRLPALVKLLNMGRMKPSFFIVGVQKCGTTSLYESLMNVDGARRGLIKENDQLALPTGKVETFQLSFPYRWSGKFTGDASHLHTHTPHGLQRIKQHYPDSKLIVILRDPVERSYSHFKMDQRIGYIPASWSFEQYIEVELAVRKNIANPADVTSVYQDSKLFHNKYGWALTRSIYHPHVQRIFDSGLRVKVIFLEDLQQNYRETMKDVMSFLQIDAAVPENKVYNAGGYDQTMKSETKQFLESFFQPHDEKLEELLKSPLPWRSK